MRRVAAAVAAAALVVGCGSESQEAQSPLDDALGYIPADAPLIVAFETGGPQSDATGELLTRVPVVGGRIYNWVDAKFGWGLIRFERDIRPLLGNEVVVGVTAPRRALAPGGLTDRLPSLVLAWRVARPDLAKRVMIRSPDLQAYGKVHGTRLWENRLGGGWFALDGDVFVATGSRAQLERALARRRDAERFSEDDFDSALEGTPGEALVRARLRPRGLIAAFPGLRGALAQRWIAALGDAGVALSARDDGFALALRARTDAEEVADADLPLAPSGPTPAALRRGSETGVGVSDPGRLARFAEQLLRAVQPARWIVLDRLRGRMKRESGVDIERDLLARVSQASVALSADGSDIAARAQVAEARRFRTALERVIPEFPKLAAAVGIRGVGVAAPAPGQRFFAAAFPGHQSVVFGLVGNSLVASDDTRRAGELVVEPARIVEGARGAAVISADAGALAERLARGRVRGIEELGIPIAFRAVGDLTGWLAISRNALTGSAHLEIGD